MFWPLTIRRGSGEEVIKKMYMHLICRSHSVLFQASGIDLVVRHITEIRRVHAGRVETPQEMIFRKSESIVESKVVVQHAAICRTDCIIGHQL